MKSMLLVCMIGMSVSRPARGGWIEIFLDVASGLRKSVPPRKGRVD